MAANAALATASQRITAIRSAGRQGYFTDDYARHFVKKPQKKDALSNRTEYAKRRAVDLTVSSLLSSVDKATLVSWEMGFDTFAMRHFATLQNTTFVEVESGPTLSAKRDVMMKVGTASFPFGPLNSTTAGIKAGRYMLTSVDDWTISPLTTVDGVVVVLTEGVQPIERLKEMVQMPLVVVSLLPTSILPIAASSFAGIKMYHATLSDLLSHYVDEEELRRLDHLERFSNVAEWAAACASQSVVVATIGDTPCGLIKLLQMGCFVEGIHAEQSDSTPDHTVAKWPVRFSFGGTGHSATLLNIGDDRSVLRVGGHGKNVTTACTCHSRTFGDIPVTPVGDILPSLCGHTCTALNPTTHVLFGGVETRTGKATNDAWLLEMDDAEYPRSLQVKCTLLSGNNKPAARSHHTLCLGEGSSIICHGGFGEDHGSILSDCWCGHIENKTINWVRREGSDSLPPLACAASVISKDRASMLLCGGLTSVFTACGDVWRVPFCPSEKVTKMPLTISARFGHSVLWGRDENELIAVGGVHMQEDEAEANHSLCNDFTAHAVCPLGDDCFAIVGGYSSNTMHRASILTVGKGTQHATTANTSQITNLLDPRRTVASSPFSTGNWARCLIDRKPHCLRGTPLGCCVEKWQVPSWLADRVDAHVSVHVAHTTRLDFANKNFTFRHVPFGELVARSFRATPAEGDEVWYFRSIAKNMRTERANFWRDFPRLADDFLLPSPLRDHIMPRLHQSCFRINQGGVHMWNHYDVMDNVLCQIVGRKRVVLFPPEQWGNLYMSGSSSKVLDIDNPDIKRFPRFLDAHRHAIEVVLEPGDTLFIPALWFHQITSLDNSISINVFYEHLPTESYDPMDLYGNKDIPAAVALKDEVVKGVMHRVAAATDVDEPYKTFALAQAIVELEEELHRLKSQ